MKNCFLHTHQTSMTHKKTGILVTFGNQDTLILNLLGSFLLNGLPNRSCCGSQSTIITLLVNFPSILTPFSHFQKTRCGMRAKTQTNILTMCVGIEDTGMADPKVKTMKPACAPSAKVCKSF